MPSWTSDARALPRLAARSHEVSHEDGRGVLRHNTVFVALSCSVCFFVFVCGSLCLDAFFSWISLIKGAVRRIWLHCSVSVLCFRALCCSCSPLFIFVSHSHRPDGLDHTPYWRFHIDIGPGEYDWLLLKYLHHWVHRHSETEPGCALPPLLWL